MVQKDLEVLKEEMKNLKIRSGSTVCSEASTGVGLGSFSTFARASASASQYSEGRWNFKVGSLTAKSVVSRD